MATILYYIFHGNKAIAKISVREKPTDGPANATPMVDHEN
jgi:hypothetical protein